MNRIAIFLFFAVFAVPAFGQTHTVYVGNQGNFSDANGTISAHNPNTGTTTSDAVPGLNTLVQHITLYEGRGYVMANTSDRVDIFDLFTNTRVGQITGVPSPRVLRPVTATKAYVSNLFSNTVTVIDYQAETVVGTIPVGENPEGIAVSGDRAYVGHYSQDFVFGAGTTLSVIDVATDAVVETRAVGCDGPRFVEADRDGDLWVFCTGKTVYNDDFTQIVAQTNGQVVVFDDAGTEVARFGLDVQIGNGVFGQDVYYDVYGRRAFVLAGHTAFVFDTAANTALDPIVFAEADLPGGLAYDFTTDLFYVGRVPSFTEAGYVTIHDATGAEVGRFDAGIIPATLAIDQTILDGPLAVEPTTHPEGFRLDANYPNPFNPTTTIPFTLTRPAHVTLTLHDALGRPVATLLDAPRAAGSYTAAWGAPALPSGTYLARLTVDGRLVLTRTLTLAK